MARHVNAVRRSGRQSAEVSLFRAVCPALVALSLATSACGAAADSGGPGPSASAVSGRTTTPLAQTSPVASPSARARWATVKPTIDKAALKYFFKIALGAEYGDNVRVVTIWAKPVVTVHVHGKGNSADNKCLKTVISDFNALTATTDLRLTSNTAADIGLHFAPVSRFRSIDPGYVSGNDGFVTVNWSSAHNITAAKILIRTSGITNRNRCHLIREELTQAMGMLRDSYDYPDSVFYQRYGPMPTRYAAVDKKIIKLLYSGAVKPGDTKNDVTDAVLAS